MRDDRFYLEYIQDSIALVEQYARDGRETYFTEPRTQDAVLRRMETLADAAAHLSALGLRHHQFSRHWVFRGSTMALKNWLVQEMGTAATCSGWRLVSARPDGPPVLTP